MLTKYVPTAFYKRLRALNDMFADIGRPLYKSTANEWDGSRSEKRDAERSAADDPVTKLKSMVTTLSRCHTLVTVMTQLGFVLALLGILAYFWTGLPQALAIFASALLGACLLAIGVVIM